MCSAWRSVRLTIQGFLNTSMPACLQSVTLWSSRPGLYMAMCFALPVLFAVGSACLCACSLVPVHSCNTLFAILCALCVQLPSRTLYSDSRALNHAKEPCTLQAEPCTLSGPGPVPSVIYSRAASGSGAPCCGALAAGVAPPSKFFYKKAFPSIPHKIRNFSK